LSAQDIEEFLESILTYADDFFQADYKFTLYHNVAKERMDFVAHIPTDKLIITFGPGYPNDDNNIGGLWGVRKLPLQVS
jgi:anthranilate/para-aminobenzoate synthase component II